MKCPARKAFGLRLSRLRRNRCSGARVRSARSPCLSREPAAMLQSESSIALTIVTLGVYSAWAKVRRLQYFYRHTRLAGAGFDYHGDPIAILKEAASSASFSSALLGDWCVNITGGRGHHHQARARDAMAAGPFSAISISQQRLSRHPVQVSRHDQSRPIMDISGFSDLHWPEPLHAVRSGTIDSSATSFRTPLSGSRDSRSMRSRRFYIT